MHHKKIITVVLAVRALDIGGAERHILALADSLDKGRFKVILVSMYTGVLLQEAKNIPSVDFYLLDKKNRYDTVDFLKKYAILLDEARADIVYSHGGEINIFSLIASKISHSKPKTIWCLHSANLDLSMYGFASKVAFYLQKVLSRYADAIVAVCESAKKYHKKMHFFMDRCTVIVNGVDTKKFRPNNNKKAIRQKLNLPEDAIVVGISARLDPVKGYEVLASASKNICEQNENIYFCSMGGDSVAIREKCITILGENAKRFLWLGACQNPNEVYQAWDIAVSSSLSEAFSLSIVEAMSCELPVVVTSVGESAFIVGECGVVVPPNDSYALANGILKLIEQKERLGKLARIRVEENFSLVRCLDHTQELLESVCREKLSIFCYSLGGGGAEKAAVALACGLSKKYNVCLVLLSKVQKYELPNDVNITYLDDDKPQNSAILRLSKLPFLAYKYKRFCKRENISLSLSLLSSPNLAAVGAKLLGSKTKMVLCEHATPSFYYKNDSLSSKIFKKILKIAYFKADSIVAVSQGSAKDLIENFQVSAKKIEVLPNPFDISHIKKMADAPCDNFPEDFVFITIGRLIESKNHQLLIRAYAKLNRDDARLLILGEGEERFKLQSLCVELGVANRVIFAGFDENPYRWLVKSHCFVFGSNLEALPTVLIEALILEVPIISTNCPSGPAEILEANGSCKIGRVEKAKFGLLVGMNDIDGMKEAMQMMVDDSSLREDYRQKGKMRAGDFESNVIIKRYDELITSLI